MTTEATLIGQVPAWIGSLDADTEPVARGPIDVTACDGQVEVSFGSGWATVDGDSALELAKSILVAEATARYATQRRMLVHAREAVERLDLTWPEGL